MTKKDKLEKIEKIVNTPYRNIFTFQTPKQEAEYQRELSERIIQEVKEVISKK
jgi:hypothetical protein